jgi:hypothetical protein
MPVARKAETAEYGGMSGSSGLIVLIVILVEPRSAPEGMKTEMSP